MLGLANDIEAAAERQVATVWKTTYGRVVPKIDGFNLSNEGIILNATYAYADLANSSQIAQVVDNEIVANVIKMFLDAATRTLRHFGGEIRSFDGDRVMAIFIGSDKENRAVRAALAINWAVIRVIRPLLEENWPASLDGWTMKHGVGIDSGYAMLVRGGVHGMNDIVSIGAPPNVAAKFSSLRYNAATYVTNEVYEELEYDLKWSSDDRWMWKEIPQQYVGKVPIIKPLASSWYKKP